jgi:outer membrane receptor for ferrienterochelin and colicins
VRRLRYMEPLLSGGVVNLISRRPVREREFLLNGTTLGSSDAILWMADEWNANWGYTVLGAVHRQGQSDIDDDGWADMPDFRRVLVRPRLFWDNGRCRSVVATVGGLAEDRRGGTVDGALGPSGSALPMEVTTRYVDLGVVARARTAGGRLFALRGSTSLLDHDHTYGNTPEDDRHATAFAEASLRGTNGRHTWVLGAAFQRDVYRSRDLPDFDYTHSVPALFVQDWVTLSPALILSASARLDAHNRYGTFVSPRLSGLLRLDPWTVRASAGAGRFAPTLFTEEAEAVGLSRVAPLSGLRAERVRSASLGLGRELGSLELHATLYVASIEDAVAAPGGGSSVPPRGVASSPTSTRQTRRGPGVVSCVSVMDVNACM